MQLVLNVHLSYCGDTAPTMRIVALSQHPETGQLLMIMQFADDGTLEMRPCESNDTWYFALSYATKLSSRLAHLHEMGFSHSDLHPGNVVFDKKYTTFLIDVGLSRAAEDSQPKDSVYGRLAYLPPESFENKKRYTQKSDIYCLGTLLWQLVVGVPPRGVASSAVTNPDGQREELIPVRQRLLMVSSGAAGTLTPTSDRALVKFTISSSYVRPN